MKLKAIIAVLLISGSAMAQNIAVFSEGTNLYRSGVVIASNFVGNTFAPSYGVFKIASVPRRLAISVSVTNGTISAGSVTNTWAIDQDYLVVDETGVFEITYAYSNTPTLQPKLIDFTGFYDGNPSHSVQVSISNTVTAAFDDISGAVIPNSAVDTSYEWSIPDPTTNYIDAAGWTYVKYTHVGSAVASHDFHTDFTSLTYADLVFTNAGEWFPFMGVAGDASLNMVTDSTNATVTTIDGGEYRIGWYASFIGSTDSVFTVRATTNGAPTDIEMWRSIGGESAVGSASAFGYEREAAGTTNGWEIRCLQSPAWITIVNGHAEVKKVSN